MRVSWHALILILILMLLLNSFGDYVCVYEMHQEKLFRVTLLPLLVWVHDGPDCICRSSSNNDANMKITVGANTV